MIPMLVLLAALAVPTAENDAISPRISGLQITPASGPRGARYTIALKIIDPQGADDVVALLYQLRERSELIRLEINDEGRGADREAHDGIYTGVSVVPDTAARGVHDFQVFVRDRDGHQSNILHYRFTVERGPRLIPI